jgi:hypothetical protein
MFNAVTGKLDIFEEFRFDGDLPKFWKNHKRGGGSSEEKEAELEGEIQEPVDSDEFEMQRRGHVKHASRLIRRMSMGSMNVMAPMQGGPMRVTPFPPDFGPRMPWWKRLFHKWGQPKSPPEPIPSMSIEEFFQDVKNSHVELSMVKERAQGYEDALKKALSTGQQALFEELSKTVEGVRAEAQLFAMGHTKYIEEATLVDFVKKSPNGLRLDWVANFTRLIPDVLAKLKLEMDERDIFDNYAVLHYDPNKKSYAQTQAEIAAERAKKADPILFGVLQGRRRLYYVGDWIDEFCDLTLDQIADTLGKKVILELT